MGLQSEEKRALVDRVARAVEVSFASQPLTRAEIHLALAASYVGVADRQNSAVQAQKALEIRQRLLPAAHSDTLHAAAELAEAYIRLGLNDRAEKLLAEWLPKVRPSQNGASFGEAWLLYEKGSLLRAQGRTNEALPYLHKSIPILNRTLGAGHIRTRNVLWNLTAATQGAGRFRGSGATLERRRERQ